MIAAVRSVITASTAVESMPRSASRDVDRKRDGTDLGDGLPGCDERHRRNDDLVAWVDVERGEAEPQSVEAAGHTDGLRGPDVLGKCLLELGDVLPADELRRLDDLGDVGEHRRLHLCVRGSQIDERNYLLGRGVHASHASQARGTCQRTGLDGSRGSTGADHDGTARGTQHGLASARRVPRAASVRRLAAGRQADTDCRGGGMAPTNRRRSR